MLPVTETKQIPLTTYAEFMRAGILRITSGAITTTSLFFPGDRAMPRIEVEPRALRIANGSGSDCGKPGQPLDWIERRHPRVHHDDARHEPDDEEQAGGAAEPAVGIDEDAGRAVAARISLAFLYRN